MKADPSKVTILKKRTIAQFKDTEKLAKAYNLDVLAAYYLELESWLLNFRSCYHLDS